MLGGKIALGFFIVGGIVSVITGYLADSYNRIKLFSTIVILGEMSCIMTFWSTNYIELYICRILTGISIGGASPIIYSLLADYYSGHHRTNLSTLIGISMGVGTGLGQAIAGFLGSTYGWRLPFLLVGFPALFFGILILLTGQEPERGRNEINESEDEIASSDRRYIKENVSDNNPIKNDDDTNNNIPSSTVEDSVTITENNAINQTISQNPVTTPGASPNPSYHYSEKIDCHKIGNLFVTRSVVLIFLQGIPGCGPWGMIGVFLNDYFSNDRKMGIALATFVMTVFGLGNVFGQLIGGLVGQYLYNKKPYLQCLLMGCSTFFGTFPMLYLINTSYTGNVFFFMMAFISGLAVAITGPNVRAVLVVQFCSFNRNIDTL